MSTRPVQHHHEQHAAGPLPLPHQYHPFHGDSDDDWHSVEQARDRVLSYVRVLEPEGKPVPEALGQVLVEDVLSPMPIPPVPNTAMDGYAVRWSDVSSASSQSPKLLKVIGELPAGSYPDRRVEAGTAIRIMTGAPIPPGADTVVPFEDTDEQARKARGASMRQVAVLKAFAKGACIRPAGEDVAEGQVVLSRGVVLRPAEIGVLASIGRTSVNVIRRPRVAVLSTGDELEEPGARLALGKIYNSNGYAICAAVQTAGGIPEPLGIARDNVASLNKKLDSAMSCDLLITSAGVSKGDYDIIQDTLSKRGHVELWSVKMRPAKPMAFGLLDRPGKGATPLPHLGLPGNPVSSLIAFEQFGRPALLKMQGLKPLARPTVLAVLDNDIANTDGRRVFARVFVYKKDGEYRATLTGSQGSNILTSMSRASGLAICPEDMPIIKAGQIVRVQMLHWNEDVF